MIFVALEQPNKLNFSCRTWIQKEFYRTLHCRVWMELNTYGAIIPDRKSNNEASL